MHGTFRSKDKVKHLYMRTVAIRLSHELTCRIPWRPRGPCYIPQTYDATQVDREENSTLYITVFYAGIVYICILMHKAYDL